MGASRSEIGIKSFIALKVGTVLYIGGVIVGSSSLPVSLFEKQLSSPFLEYGSMSVAVGLGTLIAGALLAYPENDYPDPDDGLEVEPEYLDNNCIDSDDYGTELAA